MKKNKDRGVKPLQVPVKPKDTCICQYCDIDVGKPENLCENHLKCPNMAIQQIV